MDCETKGYDRQLYTIIKNIRTSITGAVITATTRCLKVR